MNANTRINARIDDALAAKIAEARRRKGQTLTEVIRESLEMYCAATSRPPRSAFEVLEASGFVGCADAAKDLSSDYKRHLSRSLEKKG